MPVRLSEKPTHWKRARCWERPKAGGEAGNRWWDGWMVSLTQWTWIWANSRRWWRTGKPGVLQSIRLQRVWYGWVTEQLGFCSLLTDLWMVWGGGFRFVHVQLWLLLSAAQHVCTALWPPWPQEGSSWLSPLFLSVKLLTALLFGLLLLVSWSYELLLNCFLTRCQLFFPFIYLFILGCTMQLMES